MNPEQEYQRTLETTKEILDYYKGYLEKHVVIPKYGVGNKFEYQNTGKLYDYDAIYLLNDERKLNVEVKVRIELDHNSYEYSKIPIRKHGVALYYYQTHNVHTHYLALFRDGLYLCYIHEKPDEILSMVARNDRGQDEAEYAMYNHKRFKLIG